MEGFVDHYIVLGLPSGEEALKLSEKEITKAYKLKALIKRPDDPNAHEKFQRVKTSYEVLNGSCLMSILESSVRNKRRDLEFGRLPVDFCGAVDSKRRKMMSDLEDRERSGFAPNYAARGYDEEERIARKLKEEVDRIRAMYAKKRGGFETPQRAVVMKREKKIELEAGAEASVQLDKKRALKVSWDTIGEGYTAGRLREVFEKFGGVAATRTLCGDLSNPLLVVPLQRAQTDFVTAEKTSEAEQQRNIVGVGYQAYEDKGGYEPETIMEQGQSESGRPSQPR
ncbi:LOW QUALITY PROTEIN: hypothetical protein BRARA_B03709 [Brassica rapa]|uniref:J domain-containing protein n=1 Tax=Brassica campestris TaxID=3711 RepID=A0A398AND1_BRACM|nr:LOW QUALITY PROTEIN: hypothetical protein BRARA_B03709 [Brassica rapa]